MKKFLITGVRGVGKTSISGNANLKDKQINYHNYGDIMLQLGKKLNIISSGNDLDTLKEDKRVRLQDEVYIYLENILYKGLGDAILIDGHIVVETPKGFIPGLKRESLEKFQLDGIFLLTASPDEIVERRKLDEKKYSSILNWDSPKHVELHQQLILSSVLYCSMEFEIPFNIIVNEKNSQITTVDSILNSLGSHIPNFRNETW